MENDSRPGCYIDDNSSSLNMECISGQSSTTLGYATTDLSGSRRTTSETALETLVTLSPSHGVTTKQLEKQMQSPAKRSLKIVETRKKSRSLRFGRHEGYSFSSISVLKKSEQGLSFLGIRKENMKMAKSGKQSKLDPKELVKHDKQGLKPICERLRRNRLNGHTYKELLRSWARKAKVSDVLLQSKDKPSQEGGDVIESNTSNEVDKRVVESSSVLTMQRVEYDLKLQLCSSDAKLGLDLSCASLSKDGKDFEAGFSLECREELVDDMQSTESQLNVEVDREHIACAICVLGGELLCCDGRECKRSFHLSCLDPPLTCAPPGVWHCIWCVQKKIQFGVHSVSESESILDAREVESDHEVLSQKQYLVKYKGLAHVHNRWIPERQLLLETPVLLAKYKRNQITRWKNEWTLPHRLLQKRLLCFPKHCDEYLCGHDGKGLDCNYEWLVKWTGLGYDHATWELENAAFMKSPEVVRLIRDCESRQKNAKRVSCLSKEDKGREITFSELSESPSGGLPGVNNQYVSYINKLRECWYSGKNAVVFDNQERVVKVILFILSLQDDTLPLLIITTSTSLSMWEAEFSRHESSINVVVYKGNKDVRASIRSLEFYDDHGCVMFQVLLSSPDVVEDLSMLEGLKWGAIIVDEGQRPRMSVLLKKLKAVTADLRLLLLSGQIKDRRADYHNLLAFLDSELDGVKENAFENDPNYDIYKLKESLARFVAFECNLCATSFVEYWVPIQLSNVQLEQYCAALLSNSMLLCSCLKNDSVHSLREILVLTRKCCDHPYLVDVDCSLRKSVTRDFPGVEHLNVDIEVSGKLQLLDKLLLQIKERGLRVLILFQLIGSSGLISIGDILDDFVHQRFGKDSYARIDGGEIIPSKKQAALDLFNGKGSNKFVFLIESRACLRSIKLLSVDTVIIFNTDCDPRNDLRALRKITIESQFEQLKVFRLYSSYTLEEKVLILAKHGVSLDSNIQNLSRSTCHSLLTWGAPHLLNKLRDFHGCNTSVSQSNITSEQTFINDVVSELSGLLSDHGDNRIPNNSIVLEVQQTEGTYRGNFSLPGEVEAQSVENFSVIHQLLHNESPHVFWTNLLEGRHPRWKFLSGSSPRIRRRIQHVNYLPVQETEFIEDTTRRKHRAVVNDTVDLMPSKPRMKKERKLHDGAGGRPARKKYKRLPCLTDKIDNSICISDSLTVPPAAHGISRGSDGTNASALEETVIEAGQRFRAVIPITREAPTLELIGTSLPTMQPQIFPDQGSEEHPHQAQVSIHPAREGSTGNSSQYMTAVQAGNNHLVQSSPVLPEVPQSDCSDSLQMEMERIQKDKEQAIKLHEDTKLWLKAACEKEIDAVRKRYDMLLRDSETALVQEKKDLETYYNKVYANKLLAKALTEKYDDAKAAGSHGTQQVTIPGFMNEISQLYHQQTASRSKSRLKQSSASLPMTSPPVSPPIQVETHSSVHQTAGRTTLGPEQSTTNLPMTGAPTIPPAQLVDHSPAVQQTAARMTTGPAEQYSETVPITGSPVSPQMASHASASHQTTATTAMGTEQSLASLQVSHSSGVQQTTPRTAPRIEQSLASLSTTALPVMRPDHSSAVRLPSPCGPTFNSVIYCRGNIAAACEFRAPAPHLQRFRPSPEVSPPYLLHLSNGMMPSQQSPGNSSVASCQPTQVTGNNTSLPVIRGSLSGPRLPISIINLPASELRSQSLTPVKLSST
ncbi:Helicase protein MOM1 [Camellia lanceoleosa]|uniref:Helicase protein MOM1 n=1 Tax=Camellia lanceoleosa TaxID=1840588 RepID=A0ACC0HI34_9ERIC|nr:Helicase protein MOM1 [Camellia lanceoleosa]